MKKETATMDGDVSAFADAREYRGRLARLRERLAAEGSDGLYASAPATITYFARVAITPHERLVGLTVPVDGEPALVVPALEEEYARANAAGIGVVAWDDAEGPWDALERALTASRPRTLAVEKDALTVRVFEAIERILPHASFPDASPLLTELRLRKSPAELAAIRAAGVIVDECLAEVPSLLRSGAREAEIAFALDGLVRRCGGEGTPFDTIVLGGPNAALPHGTPGERELGEGDMVIVDFGAVRGGYCADVTRTFAVGEPGAREREIYDVVQEAQEAGCAAIRPGVTCAEVDAAARSVVEAAGYGELFVHRTGHGLGLEVHEPPSLVAGEDRVLEPGVVVTVEPGIYVPGVTGVRIEDDVAVTEDGFVRLTNAERALVVCSP